ncbi:22275_t:CDS:1, partial [Racocetra persica]
LSNPLQPGFLCLAGNKISNIENTSSAAINSIYRELFENQTEHSGLAVLGFYNKEIISEILNDVLFFPLYMQINRLTIVVSEIGRSLREDLLFGGPGYISSLVVYHNSEIHLVLQQILKDQCSLWGFKGKNEINQFVGETPTIV